MSAEVTIFKAVMDCLRNDPDLMSMVQYFFEGRRESVAYYQFPCVMLWVEGIEVLAERQDHVKKSMRMVAAFYVDQWDNTEMFTNELSGLLRVYNMLEGALARGANRHPPFGIADYAPVVYSVGNAAFPVVMTEHPYYGVELSFEIQYSVLNTER